MNTINYNFSNLEEVISRLKNNQSSDRLKNLKDELNKFFKDSQCRDIIYTKNDKLFFGMCVIPYIDSDLVNKLLTSEDKIKQRLNAYYLEIDSKIFELGLTTKELTAILLHEVGHVVNNTEPLEKVQDGLHNYLTKNHENINIVGLQENIPLFTFAIADSVNVVTSLFRKKDEEMLADEFVIYCGYGKELESACRKVVKKVGTINKGVPNKLLTLQWSLRVYKDMGIKRIHAIKTLNKIASLSGSELHKRYMINASNSLNTVQNESVVQESIDIFRKASELRKKMKVKGMRVIEDDLYELALQAKNVDEHDDALMVIRQINSKLAVIDDFMMSEKLDQHELERWSDVRNKYLHIREELSKKTTYDEKYYGLFVKMPNIKSRYEM